MTARLYPNARAVLLAGAMSVPALAVALALPHYWYAGLIGVAFVLALTFVDALTTAPGRAIAPEVEFPAAAYVGQNVHFEPVALVEARIEHDGRLIAVSDRDATAQRRGRARVAAVWQRWPGRFGLVWRQRRITIERTIAILPDIRPARAEAVRLFRRDAAIGATQQIAPGQGGEFQALAEFRTGMDRRSIDWKASARHGGLIAKEWRTERNHDLVFAIDSGRTMCEPVDGVARIDRAITAALAGAFVALKLGDRVSLYAFDAQPRVTSGVLTGIASFATFQNLAADLDYHAVETNFTYGLTALAARLQRRSLVLLFTEVVDVTSAEAMITTIGRLVTRHLVLFVTLRDIELEALVGAAPATSNDVARAVIAAALLRDRRIVLARLQRLGVHLVEARHDQLSSEVVNAYLALKRRNVL